MILLLVFSIFNRTPQDMLHLLAPMFEMDYLLPRSFVAVLNIERFESTVNEKRIPTDVKLSGIYTFLKKDIIYKSDKVKNKKIVTLKDNMNVNTFHAFYISIFIFIHRNIALKKIVFNSFELLNNMAVL